MQPVGRAPRRAGDGAVRLARGPGGELLAGPVVVVRRRRRHELHVDALRVHRQRGARRARSAGGSARRPCDRRRRGSRVRCGGPRAPAARRSPRGRVAPTACCSSGSSRCACTSTRGASRRSAALMRAPHEHRDAAHQARHVGVLHVVDQPLAELHGCLDDARSRAEPARRVNSSHSDRSTSSRASSSSASTSRPRAACAAPWARVGGQLCAASPMMHDAAAVPRRRARRAG